MRQKFSPLAFVSTSIFAAIALSVAAEESTPDSSVQASPVFGVTLPPGYRSWQFISVAHEAGNNNDIRGILGNDVAIKALRDGTLPFPEGSIIVRLAYEYVPSDRNNAIFGREQSFVAGAPTNVQVEIKNTKRYASTGGWGYGQFENGKANPSVKIINSCFSCHTKLPTAADLVFTSYSK
ncbi:cytochrome P460 (plasmid) [Burkholderia sp. PAMC 28687]|uniref:Putative cytochrome P460 n=1 Tax=Caballeronia sordidicola TaxID=196367 RepID=A0A242N6S2_CABSO|nr:MULTISPECIES: cytochrome P460 family protein [Burkholderiaceae]AMM18660.1 cytochrome P460 [Burkholderia sp. PAMC 28687]OTP79318.1 putative cytochrome P460 [Caballeronia sordidicola]